MQYRRKDTAAYYDCDINNLLKPSGILRCMQQTSSEHLSGAGLSAEKLYREDMAFLLSKTSLIIRRLPICGEKLVVGTALTGVKGPRFIREYFIDGEQGGRLVSAYSLWVLCSVKSRRILRPSDFPYELEMHPPEHRGDARDIEIPKAIPARALTRIQIPVRYSHIDVNNHVNNCFYADFACDALPFDELAARGVSVMALNFRAEASRGEILDIDTSRLSPLAYRISGAHQGGRRFEAYVELSEQKRQ